MASKMSLLIKVGPLAGAWHRMIGPAVGWNSAKKMLRRGPSSPQPSYLPSFGLLALGGFWLLLAGVVAAAAAAAAGVALVLWLFILELAAAAFEAERRKTIFIYGC